MPKPPPFQAELINRYDRPGPRYTSYPPATQFNDRVTESDYCRWARLSNEEPIPKPLSIYVHIPFCSSICYYCACNKVITKNKERAEPYLQDLFREIEIQSNLYDHDRVVRQLHWGGGTPGFLSPQQSGRLMNKIGAHFQLIDDGNQEYSIEIDPRVMETGSITHLRSLGFNRISLGVQDFDEKVQLAVNRVQSLATTAAVISEARQNGFKSINIDLIYGLPHQSVTSFSTTLDTVIDLDPARIAIYNYAHLPHRFPPQRRINAKDLPDSSERLSILRTAIEKLCAAGYEYIGMDHFAKPQDELAVAQRNGHLHRNFQGYSAHAQCDSIGFGISAISQVNDNFSQNTTRLDDYHQSLERQKLPVVRGFRSQTEDLMRREIIQNLICHFHLDIADIETNWGIEFATEFKSELAELSQMESDGLLEIDEAAITIRENGRLLIRNICMVFDQYQQSTQVTPLFSRTV
jgi:oxygen-independent coproporphyrinogen-3 oxidase